MSATLSGHSSLGTNNSLAAHARDAATGALTFVNAHGGYNEFVDYRSFGLAPDGAHLYVNGDYGESIFVYERNATTGAVAYSSTATHADLTYGVGSGPAGGPVLSPSANCGRRRWCW
jgi:6-phosphogluconolactonase (cycloisomerase 2 family)